MSNVIRFPRPKVVQVPQPSKQDRGLEEFSKFLEKQQQKLREILKKTGG